MITQEYLHSVLDYNPETGVFTWKVRNLSLFKAPNAGKAWNARYAGKRAGRVHSPYPGYLHREIKLKGKGRLEHGLAWIYMTGSSPDIGMCIDHKNRNSMDNRFDNLRLVTPQENGLNSSMSANNTSGISGVTWHKNEKKWMARVSANKKRVQLGYFENLIDAEAAVISARRELGYSEGHGKPKPY